MGKLVNKFGAEFLKMKGTWLVWIHLLMPFVGIVIFLLYYRSTGWNDWGKISGYIECLAIVCPTLVGMICAMSADQEKHAGHLQNILSVTKSRIACLVAKGGVLLLCNLGAMLLAVVGFALGFHLWVSDLNVAPGFYIVLTMMLWLPQFFSYCFHLFLGLRFSKGITIGAGIVESLLAALLLTGLGDGIWQYIPCAWAGRFSVYYMMDVKEKMGGILGSGQAEYMAVQSAGQMNVGIVWMAALTAVAAAALFCWLNVYEGGKIED